MLNHLTLTSHLNSIQPKPNWLFAFLIMIAGGLLLVFRKIISALQAGWVFKEASFEKRSGQGQNFEIASACKNYFELYWYSLMTYCKLKTLQSETPLVC